MLLDKRSRDKFIAGLMARMTLQEKIGQLNLLSVGSAVTGPIMSVGAEEKIKGGLAGGVFNSIGPQVVGPLQTMAVTQSRLGIPLLFGYDVIHGHRTIFPLPLGLAATWDMDLIERTARAAAGEATADGVNWVFSPMLDICRDPRWGRVAEGAGEDPFLGSRIAQAMVCGYQGADLRDPRAVAACIKHFALYGAAEAGRDYNTVDMSRWRMFDYYLPPYRAGVEAGALSVMTSFNEVDGLPATGNKWLLTTLLRKMWGFQGFVVTDYTAINEMIEHGVGDEATVGELALSAGTDMDMVGEVFLKHLADSVEEGRIKVEQIDAACRVILEAKWELGLFEDPFRGLSEERVKNEIMSPDKLALAQQAAAESIVLLKNANNVLPLRPEQKIAFVGPLVTDNRNLIGCWSAAGDWKRTTSMWQAIRQKFGSASFIHRKGCNLIDEPDLIKKLGDGQITIDEKSPAQLIDEAVEVASQSDVVVVALGECLGLTGEASCRSTIGLFENQVALLKALKATGKPIVLVLMNGRPLTLSWEDENLDAIVETWFGGTMAGAAIVDVLFGDVNPSGKLTMSFPRTLGQVPIFYNHKNTGRPFDPTQPDLEYRSRYLDVANSPLYPFGFGLSYTSFEIGPVKLNTDNIYEGETLTATVTLTNVGERAGAEVVQLYIRDLVGTVTRPVQELKGFRRIFLEPGESALVQFELTSDDLRFHNQDLEFVAEPGTFQLFIGANCRDVQAVQFELRS
ncbi:MAG: beta-glucosidase BglX [Cyanobacteria bacterium SZAS LIN-5]|nr:beta-glucosidase BglX [Cyanobacteria bacterium SZAS LIN-5]